MAEVAKITAEICENREIHCKIRHQQSSQKPYSQHLGQILIIFIHQNTW